VASVVEIGGGNTFYARELDGVGEQAGALHAYANDAEADAIVRAEDVGSGESTGQTGRYFADEIPARLHENKRLKLKSRLYL